MSKQKIFNFNFNQFDDYSNFYVNKTNFEAYNAIIKNNDQKIYLYGPNKSGKSFLGKIWCKKYNGIKYNNNFEKIININKNILIDNINNKINQEEIFHIINHCSLNNLYILITSNLLINEINFKLIDLGITINPSKNVIINNGIGIKNISRQLSHSIIIPPKTGPTPIAKTPPIVNILKAQPLLYIGYACTTAIIVWDINIPAEKPCIILEITMNVKSFDNAPIKHAIRNKIIEVLYVQ